MSSVSCSLSSPRAPAPPLSEAICGSSTECSGRAHAPVVALYENAVHDPCTTCAGEVAQLRPMIACCCRRTFCSMHVSISVGPGELLCMRQSLGTGNAEIMLESCLSVALDIQAVPESTPPWTVWMPCATFASPSCSFVSSAALSSRMIFFASASTVREGCTGSWHRLHAQPFEHQICVHLHMQLCCREPYTVAYPQDVRQQATAGCSNCLPLPSHCSQQ